MIQNCGIWFHAWMNALIKEEPDRMWPKKHQASNLLHTCISGDVSYLNINDEVLFISQGCHFGAVLSSQTRRLEQEQTV